jgi:transposase, IS5 family
MYHDLLFSLPEDIHMSAFGRTPLGELYRAIPFDELVKNVPAPRRAISGKGCKPWFDVKGGMALQILKSYYRISDALLIEQLNGNWHMQLFCGIRLNGQQIKDKDIVGRWRTYLGQHLNIDKLQISCVQHWKPYMQHIHTGFTDATVFESYIEYPTDAKLLWKACLDVYQMIKHTRRELRLRHSRINHQKRKNTYLRFAKRRKKSKRQIKKIGKFLLKYLRRLLEQLTILKQTYGIVVKNTYNKRIATIKTLLEQQWQLYFGNQSTVTDRIVSLHKPYVRPIVRGKEVKPVEFGAKVNMLVVDGISFIEHLSYDNFNEGTRLKSTVHLQKRYFGQCHQMGADAIYATNENRTYCTSNNIATSFVAKGNEGQLKEQKTQMRSILGKVRSTVLEGSFGNQKNHYQLNKVKAKTQGNEKAWIFFCLLTCNAKQMAYRITATLKANTSPPLRQAA